jgi:hypothetical protein
VALAEAATWVAAAMAVADTGNSNPCKQERDELRLVPFFACGGRGRFG